LRDVCFGPDFGIGRITFRNKALAAGAFAIGKCGAYGQAYDYAGERWRAAACQSGLGRLPR
jgi:hypothetical protein